MSTRPHTPPPITRNPDQLGSLSASTTGQLGSQHQYAKTPGNNRQQIKELIEKKADLQAEVQKLTVKNEEQVNQIAKLIVKNAKVAVTNNKLQKELVKLNTDLIVKEKQIAANVNKLEAKEKAKNEKLGKKDEQINKLTNKLAAANADVAVKKLKILELEAKLVKLEGDLADLAAKKCNKCKGCIVQYRM